MSALTLVAFIFVMRFLPDFLGWEGWEACGKDDCNIQSWLSALSGWVAAIGAGVAAAVTLRPLRQQVREARRQSDFIVGDAEPEFVLQRNKPAKRVTLKAINWNRRNVMIDKVACTDKITFQVFNLHDLKEEPDWAKRARRRKIPSFRVNSWLDRTKAPTTRRLVITFGVEGQARQDLGYDGSALEVDIDYRVIGQSHERRTTRAVAMDVTDE
ncbi:hypothetical protein ELI30_08945 [Rhizobium leguminosarum]|uniref:hypothetical protein n=2 Tax=Rhizobium leguminosarum TaxID=384 RepID=UPI001030A469|nr:hypothetical protein [Rhizobium leguminosarum]TAV48418.1 hypothetical protein ELI32_09400 [Rhizobium leguminosarum]TAV68858.1 hypothetical protein ELI30_08945 [Rhizobium leguminosarum]